MSLPGSVENVCSRMDDTQSTYSVLLVCTGESNDDQLDYLLGYMRRLLGSGIEQRGWGRPKAKKRDATTDEWQLRSLELHSKDKQLDNVVHLDGVIAKMREVMELLQCQPSRTISVRCIHRCKINDDVKERIKETARSYPALFTVQIPYKKCEERYGLTDAGELLIAKEKKVMLERDENESVKILKKMLMMSRDRRILLKRLKFLRQEFGFPSDVDTGFLERHSDKFEVIPNGPGKSPLIELIDWEDSLAVSAREQSVKTSNGSLGEFAFVLTGIEKQGLISREEIEKFQSIPFPSPYEDGLDYTDFSAASAAKRALAVVHELMSLSIEQKVHECTLNVLGEELQFPSRFTSLLASHPLIFYLSPMYRDTKKQQQHMIFLREAYDDKGNLKSKYWNNVVGIRDCYLELLKTKQHPIPNRSHRSHVRNLIEASEERGFKGANIYRWKYDYWD